MYSSPKIDVNACKINMPEPLKLVCIFAKQVVSLCITKLHFQVYFFCCLFFPFIYLFIQMILINNIATNKLRLISAVQYERKGTSYYKGISNYSLKFKKYIIMQHFYLWYTLEIPQYTAVHHSNNLTIYGKVVSVVIFQQIHLFDKSNAVIIGRLSTFYVLGHQKYELLNSFLSFGTLIIVIIKKRPNTSSEYGTVKPVLSCHAKEDKRKDFQDWLWLNAGQKYRRMLRGYFWPALSYHLSLRDSFYQFFEWPLKTGLTVQLKKVFHVKPS